MHSSVIYWNSYWYYTGAILIDSPFTVMDTWNGRFFVFKVIFFENFALGNKTYRLNKRGLLIDNWKISSVCYYLIYLLRNTLFKSLIIPRNKSLTPHKAWLLFDWSRSCDGLGAWYVCGWSGYDVRCGWCRGEQSYGFPVRWEFCIAGVYPYRSIWHWSVCR